MSWPEFVALAATTGYDAVDVELHPARDAGVERTKALFAEHRIAPGCCGVPVEFRKDDATFAADMEELAAFAALARDLDCPRMATWVPPAWETPAEQMRDILRKRFTAIADVLATCGVSLGLEFISPQHLREQGHPCVWQMADMLALCEQCGDNVGLLLDCWHWHHDPDHTVDAIVRAGRERIVTVHLNDSPDLPPSEIRDNQRVLPGEGVIDLTGFVGALKTIGYDGAVTLEIFGRLDDLSPAEAARSALDATRSVLSAC